jgi:hypothetical protein
LTLGAQPITPSPLLGVCPFENDEKSLLNRSDPGGVNDPLELDVIVDGLPRALANPVTGAMLEENPRLRVAISAMLVGASGMSTSFLSLEKLTQKLHQAIEKFAGAFGVFGSTVKEISFDHTDVAAPY